MSDYPRRRRLEPEPPKRGGVPIVPLVILVILGGLLLGGLLTRFFGNSSSGTHAPSSAPSFTPLPEESASPVETFTPSATAPNTPSPTPSETPSPSPTPSAASTASSSAPPTPSAKPTATPAEKASPKSSELAKAPAPKTPPPVIIITPEPSPQRTIAPATPPPPTVTATSTPVLITGDATRQHAGAIVRAYIGALANGDSATATGYLASGIPDETFINPNVNVSIADLRSTRNDDGTFTVTVQIATAKGNYLEAFALKPSPYGLQITSHSATRE